MKISLLMDMKMPTIVSIFISICRENFMLSWIKHEKSLITSGPGKSPEYKNVLTMSEYQQRIQKVSPFNIRQNHMRHKMQKCALRAYVTQRRARSACAHSKTVMAQTSLGPWKFIWEMVSPSHCSSIIAPGQESNGDDLGKSFWYSIQLWYVECTH